MSRTIADIPWPGPRPISFSDVGAGEAAPGLSLLVGREEELIELRRACQSYAVVELTAPSGVGKTSFLAGAKVYLEGKGSRVVQAPHWSDVMEAYEALGKRAEARDPVPLYCIALDIPICEDLAELREEVRQRDGEAPLVLVFDQFEELLRYERDLGAGLLSLIGKVAASTWVPHVVAARTEFRDRLRPVEVEDAPTWHMLLSELAEPDRIREVVEGPVPSGVELGDGVVDRIVGWWEEARSPLGQVAAGEDLDPIAARCGLLHLQALLWDLRRWAASSPAVAPQLLTLSDLEEYASCAGGDAGGGRLMADALRTYVEAAVAQYESGDWPNGPRLMLARAASHLSSAGFKVAQPVSTLAARAIQDELGSSKSGLEGQMCFDLDKEEGRKKAASLLMDSFQIEPAGVGRDWSVDRVAEEMVAALEGVLSWLAEGGPTAPNVLRRYRHGGNSVYELVHDGVAPALDSWAEGILGNPIALLGGVCVRRGEIFDHDLDASTFLADGEIKPYWSGVAKRGADGKPPIAIEGIGWHGLGVHHPDMARDERSLDPVTFEDVVFERCDFTGTLFKGVVFRNVRFEDCEMRGVAMLGCRFEKVTFDRCWMKGAAINEGAFEAVCFDCEGKPGAMNYVSMERAEPGAEVRILNLEDAAGIFLVGLEGGAWAFEDVDLSHLALEGNGTFEIRLGPRCRLGHLKLDLPSFSTNFDRREKVEIVNLTGDTSIIPSDAPGEGAATSG